MPKCVKCPKTQAKLNVGDLCVTCFKKESDTSTASNKEPIAISEIAGIPLADIENLPSLTHDNLDQPMTAGMMLKMFSDIIKPIHDKLNDHEKRIFQLETKSESADESITKVESKQTTLEQKLTASETKIKHLETANEKLKTVVTKQQYHISLQDKNARQKNVVIAGLTEDKLKDENSNEIASSDEEKVRVVLEALGLEDIIFNHCRRTGNKDQGPQDRPRFLIIEFQKQSDRNKVRAAAHLLTNFPHLKNLRIKADLNKAEREEYKRLYEVKDKLAADNPNADVIIEKGLLKMDGVQVDKFSVNSAGF